MLRLISLLPSLLPLPLILLLLLLLFLLLLLLLLLILLLLLLLLLLGGRAGFPTDTGVFVVFVEHFFSWST